MEINVGDYVRTKNKGIFKIDERCYFNKDFKEFWFKAPCDYGNEWTTTREVIKSSPNIIDLIQEGDILKVNDFKDVYTIYEVEMFRNSYTNEKYLRIRNDIGKRPKRLYEIPLVNLSIVTREQFEAMQYKVGE